MVLAAECQWQTSTVNCTSRIHLQFDISANALEIRAVQSPKCYSDVLLTVLYSLSSPSQFTISFSLE
jgi:hypothetical protein